MPTSFSTSRILTTSIKKKAPSLFLWGTVHYEPFGIYAGKCSNLAELKDGGMVAVPNDTTNEAPQRCCFCGSGPVEAEGWSRLTATRRDIVDNPKNLKIEELEAAQLVRALPDVEIAVINGNYAILGGLKVKDALAAESAGTRWLPPPTPIFWPCAPATRAAPNFKLCCRPSREKR